MEVKTANPVAICANTTPPVPAGLILHLFNHRTGLR